MKLIGVLLIVLGIVALAVGGFSYTKREKVLDIGPIQRRKRRAQDDPTAAHRWRRCRDRRHRPGDR